MDSQKIHNLGQLIEKTGVTCFPDWVSKVTLKKDPYEHQIGDISHIIRNLPRSGLWNKMGLGKTFSIQAVTLWIVGVSGKKAVVVMPPTLLQQFLENYNNNFDMSFCPLNIEIFEGDREQRQALIDKWEESGWPDVLIMSYQMFTGRTQAPRRKPKMDGDGVDASWKRESDEEYRWRRSDKVTAKNMSWEVLLHRDYALLVADEATAIKSHTSKTHESVMAFVRPYQGEESNGAILITGSPMETALTDAYGLIRIISPNAYESYEDFEYKHCVYTRISLRESRRSFKKLLGYKNQELLYRNLYAKGRRITKAQANADLQEVVVTEIPINLSEEHRKLYKKLVEEKIMELDDGSIVDATTQGALYAFTQRILACPEAMTDKEIKSNKLLETLDEIIKQANGEKVIVYVWYKETSEKLVKRYKHLNPAVLNGAVTGASRDENKKKFIKDPSCKLIIANPKSGGVGVDGFQDICSIAIFAEVYPHPGGFEQAVARVHRTGQKNAVNVYLLVPRGTVAVKLRNDLMKKEGDINRVVRDKKTLLAVLLGDADEK
jgi:SNF2 family DNA or RNA helicase